LSGAGEGRLAWIRRHPRRVAGILLVLTVFLGFGGYRGYRYQRARAHFKAAQQALQQHAWADAHKHLDACLREWPNNPSAQLLAARAARRLELLDEAQRHLDACQRDEGGETPAIRVERALLRVHRGELAAVEDFLRTRVRQDDPDAVEILDILSAGLILDYRVHEAQQCLDDLLRRQPNNFDALVRRGWTAQSMSRYADAVAYLTKALALRPDADAVRLSLAELQVALGRFTEAQAQFKVLQRRQPDHPSVLFGLARCLAGTGHKDQAVSLLDRLLAAHPNDWKALGERGWLSVEMDRPAEAEKYLRRAESLAPPDLPLLNRLADCLHLLGKEDQAREYREKADRLKADFERAAHLGDLIREKSPDDPALRHELACILLRLGKPRDALHWFQTALEKDPKYRPTHQSLAELCERSGDFAQAARHRRFLQPSAQMEYPAAKPTLTRSVSEANLPKPTLTRSASEGNPKDLPGHSPAGISLAPGYFEDVTHGSGISLVYRNGEEAGHASILESLGGGVALLDYDGDGLLDIFLTGGGYFAGPDKREIKGYPCKLYKNLGGFKFRDVTAEVGLDHLADGSPWFYTHGCAVADYDNDGWPDLLVTGYGRLALFHNVPDGRGGRRFEEVTRRAGLTDRLWSTSAAWADLDGDGFPDLYVCHYVNWSFANNPPCKDYRDQTQPDVCPPKAFQALPHALYRNNRDGTFSEVSATAGLRVPRDEAAYTRLPHLSAKSRDGLRRADQKKDYGKGLGVLIADLDGDGRPDIYVANDTSGNFLYLNRSGSTICLEEAAAERGVAYDDTGSATGSMGIDVADYNHTGNLSLFVTNYQNEAHALYRNRGQAQFIFASRSAGIAAVGLDYVGFGTGFLDFDLDGHEDIFISNGHVVHHPPPPAEVKQRPVLLRNCFRPGDKPHEVAFENVSNRAGPYFQTRHLGRGVALGDLDNDGRIDIVLNPMNEPAVLLRNHYDSGHHWLGIQLIGRPYRDAVGSRVELEVDKQTLLRTVKGGGSYLSSGDRRVIFGLDSHHQVGRLIVRWPSGNTESWEGLTVDRYWQITEGEGQVE
jgi:predicted Zn-dependent protease